MKKILKNGNSGFSLVELVIVMAIMVILAGAAFTGLTLLTSRPVDECAKKIQIALEGNRNTTMGKYSSTLYFSVDDDGVWVEEYINGASEGKKQIGQSGVTVEYTTKPYNSNTVSTNTLGSSPLAISFDRANGALNDIGDGVNYVTSFVVTRGNVRPLTVTIDRLTGRVDVQ